MRVLFVSPLVPYPPRKGTAVRIWKLMEAAAHNHRVSLIALGEPTDEARQALGRLGVDARFIPRPRRSPLGRLAQLLSGQADLVGRLASRPLERELARLLAEGEFDVLQVEGLEMAEAWRRVRRAIPGQRRPFSILDQHNAEYVLQRRAAELHDRSLAGALGRIYSGSQWRRLATYEARLGAFFDHIVTVSKEDEVALRQLDPTLPIVVIPNGVDAASFARPPNHPLEREQVLFFGAFDFRPNVEAVLWFVRAILPALRQRVPTVRVTIVGPGMPTVVRRLGRDAAVRVVGEVEDIRPCLWGSAAVVVPLRVGGGARFKVLEAFAAGVPVVSTTLGCEGVGAVNGREVLLADSPAQFAAATALMLTDEGLRQRLITNGRELAGHFDWAQITPLLEQLYLRGRSIVS